MTPPQHRLAIGIDVGTSGARAIAMDPAFAIVAQASARMSDFGEDGRDPAIWWRAVEAALGQVLGSVSRDRIVALAVDGTSGTLLPVDGEGRPLAPALMYFDAVEDRDILQAIAARAPTTSAAHGPTSGLAKLMQFQTVSAVARVLHQADWIAGRFSDRFDVSDENNALKTGYDPLNREWPDWIGRTGALPALLPVIVSPGAPVGQISSHAAADFDLPGDVIVVAGTTDGCASFLGTGADTIGDAVTALGSSLTVKILSDRPVFAPQYGIYSHRIDDLWLVGGASNTGGKVLAHYFSVEQMVELSGDIDPKTDTGLDYYPLLGKGERFPIFDPNLPPRLEPRPDDDASFLKGLFEGMAAIETLGYARLAELGGPPLRSMRTVGGGAGNPAWLAIRQARLHAPFLPALSEEAAAGTARLALKGARQAGLI
jgi:sugar (pentulose or hexulose) kinase